VQTHQFLTDATEFLRSRGRFEGLDRTDPFPVP